MCKEFKNIISYSRQISTDAAINLTDKHREIQSICEKGDRDNI